MPALQITSAMLRHPTLALGYLGAVMCAPAPDEKATRERMCEAFRHEHCREILEAFRNTDASIPASVVADLYESALTAPKLHEFRELTERASLHGLVVGKILQVIVVSDALGKPLSLKEAIGEKQDATRDTVASGIVKSLQEQRGLGEDNIKKIIWPRYRPIAHLWAARTHRYERLGRERFPCPPDDLLAFLAEAEMFRKAGERHVPKYSHHGGLLKADEMWTLPLGFLVPEATLDLQPLH